VLRRSRTPCLRASSETPVRTATGPFVPLSSLARPVRANGQGELLRENLRQMVLVSGRLEGRDLGSAVADVEQHPRLLANIKARQILKGPLIEQWTKSNEVITFSVAMEPVDRPAFAKFIFNRPTEIVEHMVTNPFAEDLEPLDKKKGVIKYQFVEVPEGTKFTAVSEFQPTTGRFYRRAWIDGIWMDFLNRLERLAITS